MAKQLNLNGRLRSAFRNGWHPCDLGAAYAAYNSVRAIHNLAPTKRLSTTLAKPDQSTANVKLRKTADLRGVAVGGRAIAQGNLGGIEACPFRTVACTDACLGSEGNYLYPRNQRVTIARKQFEYAYPHEAWTIYDHEIRKDAAYAHRHGLRLFWRPDIISDSEVWAIIPSFFARHPDVTFYGYTKNWSRMWSAPLGGWVLPNYRVAFSASELDQDIRGLVRATRVNVAMVFGVKSGVELPDDWDGIPVVDATENDTWMLEHDGVIGGLKPIGHTMKNDCTGFVRRDFVPVSISQPEEVAA